MTKAKPTLRTTSSPRNLINIERVLYAHERPNFLEELTIKVAGLKVNQAIDVIGFQNVRELEGFSEHYQANFRHHFVNEDLGFEDKEYDFEMLPNEFAYRILRIS